MENPLCQTFTRFSFFFLSREHSLLQLSLAVRNTKLFSTEHAHCLHSSLPFSFLPAFPNRFMLVSDMWSRELQCIKVKKSRIYEATRRKQELKKNVRFSCLLGLCLFGSFLQYMCNFNKIPSLSMGILFSTIYMKWGMDIPCSDSWPININFVLGGWNQESRSRESCKKSLLHFICYKCHLSLSASPPDSDDMGLLRGRE